jgi:hypothetical protein
MPWKRRQKAMPHFDYQSALREEALAQMAYLQRDIGMMNRIREQFSTEWELDELCRAIAHDEAQMVALLAERLNNE